MNWHPWRWVRRLPLLLTLPRPGAAQQAGRIIAVQRNIIPPAKLVVLCIVFYYLFSATPWSNEVWSTYFVVLETMQRFFGAYVLFSAAVIASFFVVRRFPAGLAQWIVFAVGLVDGLFLSGLTLLTGGFDSILYWVFPGVIVLNAICVPLATPQIVLNLALCGLYLGAGLLELNIRDTKSPWLDLRSPARKVFQAETLAKDLPSLIAQLKQHSDPVYQLIWNRLSETTREQVSAYPGPGAQDADMAKLLAAELSRVTAQHVIRAPPESDLPENPADPFVLRLAVLLLLTFCCYGVQVLAARQEISEEEQKELVHRTEQLHAAGRLAAEFAHQIKNPLAIINNTAFSLERALRIGKGDPAKQIEIIQEEVARADRIITQVMDYAQLSEGRVEKLDVIAELDRVIQQVFPPGVAGGIQVQRDYDGGFPPLLMQRRHFAETLINLLQNAHEAISNKGQVHVSAVCQRDYSVEIAVRDSGPGIAPDKVERIFEAYYTTKERGTGLGLAIAKHNVELYGGTLRVESELGKGAKFTVVFPAKTLMKLGK